MNQSCLFAAYKGAGSLEQLDLQVKIASEDIFSQKPEVFCPTKSATKTVEKQITKEIEKAAERKVLEAFERARIANGDTLSNSGGYLSGSGSGSGRGSSLASLGFGFGEV
ncbi:MAG: hypothetical protein R6X07_12485, partial [Desulfatiglandales bacterium]